MLAMVHEVINFGCCMFRVGLVLVGFGILTPSVRAGLYLSCESYADLPAQWRGFLLDQRTVRQIAVPAGPKIEASRAASLRRGVKKARR